MERSDRASWRTCVPAGRPRAALLLVLIVAAALRVAALGTPLYVDEIVTITVAAQPLSSMGAVMRQIDASPALFPLLLHGWMSVSHADEWVRLLPALFGWLAVPVVGLITCRAFGWRAGLAAAGVMAIAPAHVHYAQYVRSYSLFTLLVALHVLALLDWADPGTPATRARALWLVALTTALLYTHYLSLLIFPAEGLFLLSRVRQLRLRVVGWSACIATAFVLFAPGVPLLLHNIEFDAVRNADRPDPPPVITLVPNLVADLSVGQRPLGFSDPRVRQLTLGAAGIVFAAIGVAGLIHGLRTRPALTLALVATTLVPLAIYIGSGRKLVHVRFFVAFMPGYLAMLGCGLASMRPAVARAAAAALAIVCAIPLWHFYRTFEWSYDHRTVAREIAARARPGDVLLVVHPYEALYYRWYLDGLMPDRGLVFTALEDQEGYVIKPPSVELAQARPRIEAAAAAHPRLWVVGQSRRSYASDAAEEARVLAWMDSTYNRTADLGSLTGNDPVIRLYSVR